jgi:electron transfer flavoprotein subunit beta
MAARKKEITEISVEVASESAMKEVKLFSPPKRQAGVKIKTGTAEEMVAQAMQKMLEAKVF